MQPRRRLPMTYRFLKRFRRKENSVNGKKIPIAESELRGSSSGRPPAVIPEDDYFPLGHPPSLDDIRATVNRLKGGTCPGQDVLQAELFQNGSPELFELLEMVISQVWKDNVVPVDWLNTTQVPLPKCRTPKSVDDYRRLTMSNSIYKIYAFSLLSQLESYIGEIPLYQAGFLRNRSTDDHVFTLRRVCEERWRHGLPTYVLSLDLRKAFDMVDSGHA